MATQLSKLHVRFIQSQKSFLLLIGKDKKGQKLPLSQLYIKDNDSFYLIFETKTLTDKEPLEIHFNEATHALKTLTCTVTSQEIVQETEEYEDALLFFNVDTSKVKQLFQLHITEIKET